MEFISYSTQQNELIRINPAHIVALYSFINDDATAARFEIHTSSSALKIVQEFDDVDKMKAEFDRFERLAGINSVFTTSKLAYDQQEDWTPGKGTKWQPGS